MSSILQRISEDSIFYLSLSPTKNSLSIHEACDYYYSINLNKQEVKTFIEELTTIYDEME